MQLRLDRRNIVPETFCCCLLLGCAYLKIYFLSFCVMLFHVDFLSVFPLHSTCCYLSDFAHSLGLLLFGRHNKERGRFMNCFHICRLPVRWLPNGTACSSLCELVCVPVRRAAIISGYGVAADITHLTLSRCAICINK